MMPGDWGVWKIVLQRRWRLLPKRWRFGRSHDKPMHASCPSTFQVVYIYVHIYLHTIHRRRCLVGLYTHYTHLYYSTSLLQKDLPSQISPCGLQPTPDVNQGRESRSQRGSKSVPEVSEKTPVEVAWLMMFPYLCAEKQRAIIAVTLCLSCHVGDFLITTSSLVGIWVYFLLRWISITGWPHKVLNVLPLNAWDWD